MKIPRNAPCPCGSGKKYKRCCSDKAVTPETGETKVVGSIDLSKPPGERFLDSAKRASLDQKEEFRALIAEAAAMEDDQPIDELLGLRPVQIEKLLNFPFSSPEVLSFNEQWVSDSNFMHLFDELITFIQTGSAKATARGFLPLTWCRELHQRYRDGLNDTIGTIRSEQNFDQLNAVRVVAEAAELITIDDGHFKLTPRYTDLKEESRGELCKLLFKTYAQRYYWACRDTFEEIQIVQSSFAYTLYMLSLFGEQQRPVTYYEDLFLKGFLKGIKLDEPEWGKNCEQELRDMYCCRAIERFAYFWGLIEMKREGKKQGTHAWQIKKTAQLDSLVTFHC